MSRHRSRVVAAVVVLLLPLLVAARPSPGGGGGQGGLPDGSLERLGPDGTTAMLLGAPFLTGPTATDAAQVALDYVAQHGRRFGLTPPQVDELVVASDVTTEHNGARHVVVGREIGGHRVANSGITVVLDAEGRIVLAGGRLESGPARAGGAVRAMDAVRAAGAAVGVDVPRQLPRQADVNGQRRFVNTFASTVQPNPVTAELVWYPADRGRSLRLAWEVDFEVDGETWVYGFVDARSGEVLHRENRYVHAQPEGAVFTGQHPDDSPARSTEAFSGINGTWVTGRVTTGNNVDAYRDLADNDDPTDADSYRPETPASGDPEYQHFDYAWTDAWRDSANGSDASLDADIDAVITQLFYYTNVMHNWLYDYGFDEAAGNFQQDNFGKGGAGGDPVLAEAQDGWDVGSRNNANFATPADGASPRMQMFMWAPPNRPYRDGSMDGDVIAHEYGHGVSSRLVGGGNLGYGTHLVHASLGEGWSDVISFLKWEDTTVGEYVTGNAGTGIRSVAYDTSNLTYNDYNPFAGSGHPNGEVWATMVYDIREALGVDADNANGGTNYCLLWRIFADTGLGTQATFSKTSTSAPADDDGVPSECVPTADADGPYATDEGTDVGLDATGSTPATHPSGGIIVGYEWDLDDDGDFDDATGATPTFDEVGDDLMRTVSVRVTDSLGSTAEDSSTVTVSNVDPVVALDAVSSTSGNTAITLTGTVTDAGWLDDLSATVDWDDGAGALPLSGTAENVEPDATLTLDVDHTYGDDGTYTIEVCGYDDDDGTDCTTVQATITNTAPTADIDEDTYLTSVDVPLDVSGTSTDPGSDDLTATWGWDDGSADTVTTDLVNPPLTDPAKSPSIQPRDIGWDATRSYTEACLRTLTLDVDDDDERGDGRHRHRDHRRRRRAHVRLRLLDEPVPAEAAERLVMERGASSTITLPPGSVVEADGDAVAVFPIASFDDAGAAMWEARAVELGTTTILATVDDTSIRWDVTVHD